MHPFGATLQLAVSYYVKWLFCGDDGGGIKAEFGRETNVGAAQRRVVDPTFIQHEACAGGDAPQKNRAGGKRKLEPLVASAVHGRCGKRVNKRSVSAEPPKESWPESAGPARSSNY